MQKYTLPSCFNTINEAPIYYYVFTATALPEQTVAQLCCYHFSIRVCLVPGVSCPDLWNTTSYYSLIINKGQSQTQYCRRAQPVFMFSLRESAAYDAHTCGDCSVAQMETQSHEPAMNFLRKTRLRLIKFFQNLSIQFQKLMPRVKCLILPRSWGVVWWGIFWVFWPSWSWQVRHLQSPVLKGAPCTAGALLEHSFCGTSDPRISTSGASRKPNFFFGMEQGELNFLLQWKGNQIHLSEFNHLCFAVPIICPL